MRARIFYIALLSAVVFFLPMMAQADGIDTVTITLSPISGTPDSTVDVMGTITNSGPDILNIDSDNISISDPLICDGCGAAQPDQIVLDDEFLNNAPFTQGTGTSDPFEFFELTFGPSVAPGIYGTDNSDVFQFFGDFNGNPVEVDVDFTVDVTSPATSTPEPSSLLLLGSGLAILGLIRLLSPRASQINYSMT